MNEHLFPYTVDGTVFNDVEQYALQVATVALRHCEPHYDNYLPYASAVRQRRHERRVRELENDLVFVASMHEFCDMYLLEDAWDEVIGHPC